MRIKELLTDDDAVSPVIGVILMVAITVILAAVIATFVLGLGEQVSDTAPNANFQWEYNSGNDDVLATHTSGPAIEADSLKFGGPGYAGGDGSFTNYGFSSGDEVSAGDTAEITTTSDFNNGERISIIWTSEGDSATLSNYEIPS
ncbi:type IV pilin N-terminal domain-containing protein [Halovenus sp. HT40]|uniref:type IV pilin N-terminal domain-containing protein n=1 Tax=Halovenus sp. HT40 TaxID=3126691 RepID=UPI00300EFED5